MVRARPEDAGEVVRCSYCGRNATVPVDTGGLDFLAQEIEASVQAERAERPVRSIWTMISGSGGKKTKKKSGSAGFQFLPVIFKLFYVGMLLGAVYLVGKHTVYPLIRDGFATKDVKPRSEGNSATPGDPAIEAPQPVQKLRGLVIGRPRHGLYVSSTPTGALVWCIEVGRAPAKGRIAGISGARSSRTDGACPNTPPGQYVVEVAIPWNDKALARHEGYVDFRRRVESGTETERKNYFEGFFLPDESFDSFVDQTSDQIYLVRQYRAEVGRDQLGGVRALFLPRLKSEVRGAFAIDPLLAEHLPRTRAYLFDEELVRNELAYYEVPEADRGGVIEALYRVGAIPFATPDGRTRMFMVNVSDGMFSTRVIRDRS